VPLVHGRSALALQARYAVIPDRQRSADPWLAGIRFVGHNSEVHLHVKAASVKHAELLCDGHVTRHSPKREAHAAGQLLLQPWNEVAGLLHVHRRAYNASSHHNIAHWQHPHGQVECVQVLPHHVVHTLHLAAYFFERRKLRAVRCDREREALVAQQPLDSVLHASSNLMYVLFVSNKILGDMSR
jgi:hypothetical protein